MSYRVHVVDLSAILPETTLVDPGNVVAELFMLSFPSGASFLLRVGNNTDWMTVTDRFFMEPRGDNDAKSGVYVKNITVQAGTLVELITVAVGALNPVL